MPKVTARGLKFFYQQAGSGPDVVLLHGVTGNMAIWMLSNLFKTLAADFRVTAYDLRGHGYSDTSPDGYTSADMAADFAAIHEALGLQPAYLLGHSFGGVVALHAAAHRPERVAGVILSDPFFPGLHHLEANIGQWDGWEAYQDQCRRSGLAVSVDNWFDVNNVLQQTASLPAEHREALEKEVGAAGVDRLVRLAATTCGMDVQQVAGLTEERIVSVRQPVLALYGEQSPFMNTCRFLEKNLSDCKVVLVPAAKHLAHEENPAAYVELVQKHLREMTGLTQPVGGAT